MKRPSFFFDEDTGGGTGGTGGAGATGTLLSGATGGDGATTTTTTSAATGGSTWFSDDAGTFAPGWVERLPQDLRGNASLTVVPSIEALAKSYVETKSLVGKKLEAPGEGATPEQVAAWRKTLGAPEKPEGYLGDAKTLRPEALPENMWNPDVEKGFLAIAHKHHLTPAAVKEIIGFHGNSIKAQLDAGQAKEGEVLQGELGKLREAWKTDFDANLTLAGRVAATVGLSADHAIFTNADVVQAFAKLGKLFSEDRLVSGENMGINGSIEGRIREITDPQSSAVLAKEYRGELGPDRQNAAQKQLHELYATRDRK